MRRFSFSTVVLIIGFISFFTLFQKSGFAQVNMGSLSSFKGEVELIRAGKPVLLKLKMPILSNDIIRSKDGIAVINFKDDSTIRIRPNSEMTMQETKKKRKIFGLWSKTYLSRLINIIKGTVSGDIRKSETLVTEFETPALVAAVRGTTLTVVQNPDGTVGVDVTDGTVVGTSTDEGGWTTVTLENGDQVMYKVESDGTANIYSVTGDFNVISGDITSTVNANEQMAAKVNFDTGAASVKAVQGTIDVNVGGATATLNEGQSIDGDVDEDGNAIIQNTGEGDIDVTAGGETVTLKPGEQSRVPNEGLPGAAEPFTEDVGPGITIPITPPPTGSGSPI